MPERIRLRICPACRTGIPVEASRCPECGAEVPSSDDVRAPAEEGFGGVLGEILASLYGGGPAPAPRGRRAWAGPLVRSFLGRHLGCLWTALLVVFVPPLLLGALAGNALAGLGVLLLVVGGLGLVLTAWLIWLVGPWRRRGGPRATDGR